jgi:predicted dithiol-disulfide oxidoreductase (DUF899 family)
MKNGSPRASSCSRAKRSTRGSATRLRSSDASSLGCAWRREYRFDTDDGEKALAELFDGRSQLLVYHFMFGPSYEAGDPVNSSIADAVNGVLPHLHARDATMLLVSRAPLDKLQAYKRRMGWSIPWVSDGASGFNSDYDFSSTEEQTRELLPTMLENGTMPPIVEQNATAAGTDPVSYLSEGFGFTAFVLDDDVVYHTYSAYSRGFDALWTMWQWLDRAPLGRNEGDFSWFRRHDQYDHSYR